MGVGTGANANHAYTPIPAKYTPNNPPSMESKPQITDAHRSSTSLPSYFTDTEGQRAWRGTKLSRKKTVKVCSGVVLVLFTILALIVLVFDVPGTRMGWSMSKGVDKPDNAVKTLQEQVEELIASLNLGGVRDGWVG
ncbi:hypothetical protein ACEQ8H_008834 [Pleosporales sp. CAS-2024a]